MKSYTQILNENKAWAQEIIGKIDKKMQMVALRSRHKLPDGVDENRVHIDNYGTRPNFWTNGFFGGLCAMLYEYTKNEEYFKTLEESERLLDRALNECYETIHHDVGFMWYLTSGAKYRLTGDEGSKRRLFYTAATLAGRFIVGGNFIKAWNVPKAYDWTIIDCLMNLPLLYHASEIFGDDRYKRLAIAHANTAMETHVREDGSVIHIVEHDRDTGKSLKTHGGQGYQDGSAWSRGQAWALYGFVISHIHTGDKGYLDTARRVADYFIESVRGDWLPRVDFKAPREPVYYDSTAGVCAACGMLELARLLPEREGGVYAEAAINILRAITDKFVDFNPEFDDMVGFGSIRYPLEKEDEKGVHISIIYGDFFYTEAILKLLGSEFFMW